MNYKALTLILASTLAMNASAGVAEKKAIKQADEKIVAATTKTMSACGNTQLVTTADWEQFNNVAESNAEKLKAKDYKGEWLISKAGERTVTSLEALEKICLKDADYKEEVAKITEIMVVPKADFDDVESEFSLEGTKLTIQTGHYMDRSFSDFTKPLKSVF